MRMMVFGSTGGTGRQLVMQALAQDHDVTAVVRRPEAIGIADPRLTVVVGDVREPERWVSALHPGDVVLSALGIGSGRSPGRLYSDGIASVIGAMSDRDCRRLLAISAAPVAPGAEKTRADRRLLHPIIGKVFGEVYADMARMETLLGKSGLEWTVLRPPRLTDGRSTGRYRTAVGEPLARARSISRADLATAILAAVNDRALVGRSVAVAS